MPENSHHDDLFRLIRKKQWNHVATRVGLFPEESIACKSYTFSNGITISTLPLHLACMYQAPLKAILSLIAADPSTCKEKDGVGRTPLYNAVRYGCSYEVISVLIATYPNAVNIMADDGRLPIHIACSSATSVRENLPTIKHLLWSSPDSLLISDLSGDSPRDCTMKNTNHDVKEEILRELVRYEANLIGANHFERSNDDANYESLVNPSGMEIMMSNQRSNIELGDSSAGFQLMNDMNGILEGGSNSTSMASNEGKTNATMTKQCVICMERPVSRLLVPCGHPCLCDHCAIPVTMDRLQWKCPECRTKTLSIVRFFGRITLDE